MYEHLDYQIGNNYRVFRHIQFGAPLEAIIISMMEEFKSNHNFNVDYSVVIGGMQQYALYEKFTAC